MPNDSSDRLPVLLERLVGAGVAITSRALIEAAPGLDLTFPQWRTLVVVGGAPAGMTVTEVATRLGVTVPATSRQLHRLARRGLLQLRQDEHDRRAVRVGLTALGLRARDDILAFRRDRISELAANVPVTARVLQDLARVVDAFDVDR
jgi:DNA-binding MarR family transcriptional regulator